MLTSVVLACYLKVDQIMLDSYRNLKNYKQNTQHM